MSGYKTWLGIGAGCIYAVSGMILNKLSLMDAIPYFIAAWTTYGIGHKIERFKR